MISQRERVARLIKPIWLSKGQVASAAFSLRPHIHETYVSVLREETEAFVTDISKITNQPVVHYASMAVSEIEALQVKSIEDKISFTVKPVDNDKLRSHAGIFVFINGLQVVGGEPFESLELKKGASAGAVLLEIRKALAKLASKQIMEIHNE